VRRLLARGKANRTKKSLSWQHGHVGGFVNTELTESQSLVVCVRRACKGMAIIANNQ
jgi:hypothetical protein